MTGGSRARIRSAIGRLREAGGGVRGAFLDEDRRVLAADGDANEAAWRAILREADARWGTWRTFERDDVFVANERHVLAHWMTPHGVLLVELAPEVTLGLARLRMKTALVELERALASMADEH